VQGGHLARKGVPLMVAPWMRFWLLPSRMSCVFDFNVSYSSCWGYSLINTLKLKKKIEPLKVTPNKRTSTLRCAAATTITRITTPTRGASRWVTRKSLHHLHLGRRLGMKSWFLTSYAEQASSARPLWLSAMTSTLWANGARRCARYWA